MYRDFDYIKTKDGIIFIVRGDHHTQKVVRATPVFIPSEEGNRLDKKTGQKYIRKIEEYPSSATILPKIHPEYLPKKNEMIRYSFLIPIQDISKHYKPRDKTRESLCDGSLKNTKWEKIILAINRIAKIPIKSIGIYGSFLVGLETDDSDIDIVIYGHNNFIKFRNKFEAILANSKIRKASRRQRLARVILRKKHYRIDLAKLEIMEFRRWNRINVYGNNITSIRFAYADNEISKNPITSPPLKEIKVTGKVIESEKTHFYPRIAKVLVKGKVIEVVSYGFLFFSCVSDNDNVEIFGNFRKDGQREYITLDEDNHYLCPLGK